MNKLSVIRVALIFHLLCFISFSQAGQDTRWQSHTSISSAVDRFLQSQTLDENISKRSISVGYLDPRLKLKKCQQELQTFLAPGNNLLGKTTVGVRCSDAKPWALYVSATVNNYAQVYQTRLNIEKGQLITNADIIAVEKNLSQLRYGYFRNKDSIIGKAATRRLNPGIIISPHYVKAPILIKRGEQVALIASASGFSVRMSGKAMMNGTLGQHIRVKNLSSKRVIEGTVTRNGEVIVK